MRAKKLISIAAGLLGVALTALPLQGAFAQAAQPVKIQMEITDSGWNCLQGCSAVALAADKWDYTISVDQGAQVEISFRWSHKGYFHDEHIFVLEGYMQEWEKVNSEHRDATATFVADKPGTFTLKCDLDCEVHDYLQRGHLKVSRGGGGGAAASLIPTKLALTPSTWITTGDPLTVSAALTDKDGNPVPKADVQFFLHAEFGGQEGDMLVGAGKTDAKGVAVLQFIPTTQGGKHAITARFAGKGMFNESEQAIAIEQIGAAPAGYVPAPIGLDKVRDSGHLGLAALILIIWSVFAFVLFQAVGVSWTGRKKTKQRN